MALGQKLSTATPTTATKPPNLRRGNARQRCALCKFFDGRGECVKFGYPVRPTQLCDSYAKAATK